MKTFLLSIALSVLLAVASALAAPTVHEFDLANGMKVLVQVDRRAPVAVSQVWYRVGSSYEPSGITGISHLLEHMMFKGTTTLEPGEFSRIIAANGGDHNAFTSRDYTAYYQKLHKDRLEVSLRLEADRMRNLLLDPAEFARERLVVIEERRLRTEDSPEALTYELFNAAAYVASPYRHPIIGWMSDLETMRLADLQDWYKRWYAPNNATLVVVGDVDPQAVLALAKQYFGPLAPQPLAALQSTREPPQRGERRTLVKVPAQLPYVILGYPVPVIKTAEQDWEPYALTVLAGILDQGDSARLSRELVRGRALAASAGAGYNPLSRLEGRFILAANPAPGHEMAELEQALRDQVRQLQAEPVTAAELQRVVAQIVAADVYRLDSMFYQGMRLGIAETVGLGWQTLADYIDRIEAVTPAQIRAVARKYLTDDHLTVAVLEPQAGDETVQTAVSGRPPSAIVAH